MTTLDAVKAKYPNACTFQFGDTPDLIRDLTALVRTGRKRATCTAVIDIEAGRETAPVPGRRDIALDAQGNPALVIETLEVRHTTWQNMTEDMALAEGEDDTLDAWRAGHRSYYTRQGIFDPEMQLIWERFFVVEDFGT
ncbi:MAG: ASCH domain-containing protein [Roseobacter sp.]